MLALLPHMPHPPLKLAVNNAYVLIGMRFAMPGCGARGKGECPTLSRHFNLEFFRFKARSCCDLIAAMDMAEHHEQRPLGDRVVGAQAAEHHAAGPKGGSQDGLASASGSAINGDRLLTVAETVELTGYSEESIRRWIRKGALPIERIGPYRRVRVRFSVLRQLFPP